MPSRARAAFDANIADAHRLLALQQKGSSASIDKTEVLNKSAVVLTTAYWEAYCEDLAAEALEHLVQYAESPEDLPLELRRTVARELKDDLHHLAVWKLAGDGWRSVLTERLVAMQEERNRSLNTPKTTQINEFFKKALGVSNVSGSWRLKRMSSKAASELLDDFVTLRGNIAHRGQASERVSKGQATEYVNHVTQLVSKTGGRINDTVRKTTGHPIWEPPVYRSLSGLDDDQIKEVVKVLTPRERRFVRARLGIERVSDIPPLPGVENTRTLKESAMVLGLKADLVRRTEKKLVSKIRRSVLEG